MYIHTMVYCLLVMLVNLDIYIYIYIYIYIHLCTYTLYLHTNTYIHLYIYAGEELWGLTINPIKDQFCTVGDDAFLKIWDLLSHSVVTIYICEYMYMYIYI
jgi:hypothetical protein